jgi:prevent-host-death family protein
MSIIKGTAEIKAHFSEFINRVRYQSERILIARRGKPVAALVSIDDFHRLESLENQAAMDLKKNSHPIMRAFGGWSELDDLDELVEDIYNLRKLNVGREVDL